jgi:hypothetical protein
MSSLRPICPHFLKGTCKYGDKCNKSHAAPQGSIVKHRDDAKGEGMLQKKQGGKTAMRTSTTTEMVTQADGSVIARETVVKEVVWTPYSAHAGRTSGPKEAARDSFGNCKGPKFDLSPDDAFKGEIIAILQLYTGEGFTFATPSAALSRKGFEILHWTSLPPLEEFQEGRFVTNAACWLYNFEGRGNRRPRGGAGTATKSKVPQGLHTAPKPAATFDLDKDDLVCHHFLKGTCKYGDKCKKSHERPKAPPKTVISGGESTSGHSAQGSIHPKSTLARNVASLLASAPGRCVPGTALPGAYVARFGVKLDYQGGQLKDLLDRLETGGSCRVEKRQMPKGPALLHVYSA